MNEPDNSTEIVPNAHQHLVNRLEQVMSDLSEDYWCAGWLIGTARALWRAAEHDERVWGLGRLSDEEVKTLRELSELTGGWFDGNEFVPIDVWRERMADPTYKAPDERF